MYYTTIFKRKSKTVYYFILASLHAKSGAGGNGYIDTEIPLLTVLY